MNSIDYAWMMVIWNVQFDIRCLVYNNEISFRIQLSMRFVLCYIAG